MHEPVGTVGLLVPRMCIARATIARDAAIAMGNTVVAVPSERYPLIIGDLYQVLETSDLPGGVVNMVSGRSTELLKVLAEHDDWTPSGRLRARRAVPRRNRYGWQSEASL